MTVRNPFDAPDVTSRRGGRVKPPLSRDAIVTEALEELTRDGLAGRVVPPKPMKRASAREAS
jgi:hypothetical protein